MVISCVPAAVLLDRDGVLVASQVRGGKPYAPRSLAEFSILDDAVPATRRLQAAGVLIAVVTNQPDVGHGLVAREVVEAMNQAIERAMPVEAVLTCWHRQDEGCDCRKPKPGLLVKAARRLGVALDKCVMVGDRFSDVKAGEAAGCATVLIDRGYEGDVGHCRPDAIVGSIGEAVDLVLSGLSRKGGSP